MSNLPALKIKPQDAIERIREKFPDEAAALEAVVKNNVVALGTDEAFALRDNEGIIRCYKQPLRLSGKDGTLIQPVPNGPFVVSAQGYEHWQEAAGACVIFPSEVLVDGKWQQNPYVMRDEKNRRILCIVARAVAFRYSNKGIPQVSDWTTMFDTPSYRMIDLLAKAKQYPQAFQLLPVDMKPEKDGTWAAYPFDESTQLWVNTAHNEVLGWFSQIINREKKAIDFAQTFAKRNALKHLSGLQKAPASEWVIPVLCWRPTAGNIIKWDATQYAMLQERVGNLISGDRAEFKQIELKTGTERVSEEDGIEGVLAETDPEDQAEEQSADQPQDSGNGQEKQEKKTSKKKLAEVDQRIIDNLKIAIEQFPEDFKAACVGLQKKAAEAHEYDPKTAEAIMREINRIIDTRNQ